MKNRILMDLGAEVFNYNLHLLPGTEMDSAGRVNVISPAPGGVYTTTRSAFTTA